MAAKRSKYDHENASQDISMSLADAILSSDINNSIQAPSITNTYPYHTSICGSLLYSSPTNSPAEIFSYLRHANFIAFRRSLDVYHNDIIRMRNDHEQTVLHILVIHAYQYVWVRLLMMRGCDTCAQDSDGYTAAHYAVERDDVEMLKALTIRFQTQTKPISDDQITTIHNQCLKALTIRNKQGLTVFMLACHHESIKCLDYLIGLNINDCNLEDNYGDTCLQYAIARSNKILIEKLINTCQANVNGGKELRPSALDISQFNRNQQKPNERIDDEIEKLLLSRDAKNRCLIRRVINKRKVSTDNDETMVSNLACLSIDITTNGQIETARTHARRAVALKENGDLTGAQESYRHAMSYTPNDTVDWATYAYQVAIVHKNRGEQQQALDLLQKAIRIRKHLENDSQEINQIQRDIDDIQQQTP